MERLFIVDSGWGVVHLMDMGKGLYSVIPYGGERKFQSPIGVTGDDGDNVYITDSAAGTIWRYTVGQDSVQQFTPFKLGRPTGIAYSREKHLLYVSDTTAHQIIVFDLSGRERFRFGTRGSGPRQFNFPTDLFVDRLGRVFVTDPLNHRIQFFSPEGDYLGAIGQPGDAAGYLSKPKGVAVDSEGHIYVCDALQDAVQIFDENGQVLLSFGEQGDAPGEFWMPSGIYIDRDDTIYVSDTYNQRIQVFKYLKTQGAGWDTKGLASRTGTSPNPSK
jgi:DNA-binding beta-propeller fold protein YncE